MKFLYALRFLTVLPLPWKEGEDLKTVARSLSLFPVAGGLIGLFLWGSMLLFSSLFPPGVTGFLVLVLWVFITGALHLDGVSDVADGLGGSRNPEKSLEIMKDSRIGAFGAAALILILLGKYSVLRELTHPVGLILAPVAARCYQVIMIWFFPCARKGGMGDFFKENIRKRELITALITTWIMLFCIGGTEALLLFVITLVPISLFAHYTGRRLKGLTGDVYGTLCEGGELLFLLFSLLIPPGGGFLW